MESWISYSNGAVMLIQAVKKDIWGTTGNDPKRERGRVPLAFNIQWMMCIYRRMARVQTGSKTFPDSLNYYCWNRNSNEGTSKEESNLFARHTPPKENIIMALKSTWIPLPFWANLCFKNDPKKPGQCQILSVWWNLELKINDVIIG